MIKLENVRRHGHAGKSHHHGSYGNKNSGKAKFGSGKQPFFGKEVNIQQANGKADVNDNRRNNTLPPDITHEVKITGLRFKGFKV